MSEQKRIRRTLLLILVVVFGTGSLVTIAITITSAWCTVGSLRVAGHGPLHLRPVSGAEGRQPTRKFRSDDDVEAANDSVELALPRIFARNRLGVDVCSLGYKLFVTRSAVAVEEIALIPNSADCHWLRGWDLRVGNVTASSSEDAVTLVAEFVLVDGLGATFLSEPVTLGVGRDGGLTVE